LQPTCNQLATDTISRQAAIDALGEEPEVWTGKDEYAQGLNNQWHYDRNAIMALPSSQPKHGKWKPRYYDVGADVYVEWACSECGYIRQKGREDGDAGEEPEAKFCENCGAKMERGEDE
jgi:hypothetical protein